MALLIFALPAAAQVCPAASNLGTGPNTGIVNNYYPGTSSLAVGATTLVLGTPDARGLNTAVVVGDLLMVIQMQDGTINSSNTSNYGNATGNGQGSTSVGQAGLFEFVRVTSTAPFAFSPPLTNGYVRAAATASTAQQSYQVVRVPQYTSLNATGIYTPPWNGATGGVVAVDVRDTLTLTNSAVEGQSAAFFTAGKGFRGAAGVQLTGNSGASTDYVTLSTALTNGGKGEGFIGTPIQLATLTSGWAVRNTVAPAIALTTGTFEGYPGGSYAAGAPGNAGGGGTDGRDARNGNDENAGGGGGGNYGPGGIGGRPWNDPLKDTGGRGGAGYAGTLAFNRVFMGGGGGAGGTNNGTADNAVYTNNGVACSLGAGICSSGATGGGIVIIRARAINGAGTIDVRGAHGYNVLNDAGGGGGAGGSVVIQTSNGGNATVDATGGDGGNAWAGNAGGLAGRHGPGGAGGGGFIAYAPTSMSISAGVNGGAPGRTMSNLTPEENYGSTGFNGGLTAFLAPNIPGAPPAAQCGPNLTLGKSDGVTSVTAGNTTTYTFTVFNSGIGATLGTLTVSDQLPTGLSVVPGALSVTGPNAASWSCNAANATDITCTSTSAVPGSGSSSFAVAARVAAGGGPSLVNRAIVAGGGDTNKPLYANAAAGIAAAAACTANNTPAGCALDTDTVVAPNLSLTKSDGTTTIVQGATVSFSLVVTNGGTTPTSGTITVLDVLPTGLTYVGTTTVNGFSCSNAAPTLTCTRATALAAGATATISFTVSVDANAPSSVTNRARVGGGGDPSLLKSTPVAASVTACADPVPPATTSADANTGCAADTDSVQYVSLSLTKDDGQPFVSLGGTTDYVFVVSNIGSAASSGVINFRDVLPGTMTYVGAGTPFSPAGLNGVDWTCVRNSTTDVSCTSSVPIAAGSSSSFILSANVGAAAAGVQQRNRARVGGGGDVTPSKPTSPSATDVNNCISDGNGPGCAIDLNTVQDAPQVRLTKVHTGTQSKNPGDTFAFVLTVRNSGGSASAVNTVRLRDVVPVGLTISAVAAGTPFTCVFAGQNVTCNNTLGALNAGVSSVITVTVTVAAGATNPLLNAAKVGTNGTDPQNNTYPTVLTAALCTDVDVPNYGCAADSVPLNADLQITKTQRQGNSGAFATTLANVVPLNTTVQFLLTVSNGGPSNVSTATIADTVPNNFSTVTWVCANSGGTATCGTASGSGNAISLTGSINNASSLTITVTAVTSAATTVAGVTNTASVIAPSGITDTTPANNTASVVTKIGATNLAITKSNGVSSLVAGTTTAYTIVVTNTGSYPADGARLYDPVAIGLQCTAPPSCVAAGSATACPVGLTAAQLQNTTPPTGVLLDTFGAGGSLTFLLSCGVTATGQ
ncbi:MAG: DUF11 domain-containing protein [Bdellovibrionales bacterium]|nr:DUF11 domain-containing protein [Ramlibacter sp.]